MGPGGRRRIASATTLVVMRTITPEEVDQYVASGEWEGKAGGYAIQETADRFVDRVEGSFSNVVGLPVELVLISTLSSDPAVSQVVGWPPGFCPVAVQVLVLGWNQKRGKREESVVWPQNWARLIVETQLAFRLYLK